MKYTVDYFIEKFEAIPEDNWITGKYYDPEIGCCALGWCGEKNFEETVESNSLTNLLKGWVAEINDGTLHGQHIKYRKFTTPKQRILAALNDIKKGVK